MTEKESKSKGECRQYQETDDQRTELNEEYTRHHFLNTADTFFYQVAASLSSSVPVSSSICCLVVPPI